MPHYVATKFTVPSVYKYDAIIHRREQVAAPPRYTEFRCAYLPADRNISEKAPGSQKTRKIFCKTSSGTLVTKFAFADALPRGRIDNGEFRRTPGLLISMSRPLFAPHIEQLCCLPRLARNSGNLGPSILLSQLTATVTLVEVESTNLSSIMKSDGTVVIEDDYMVSKRLESIMGDGTYVEAESEKAKKDKGKEKEKAD
ncbi:hypothetical protein J3A83DRAFT_4186465 [Scleroderma citrinum]